MKSLLLFSFFFLLAFNLVLTMALPNQAENRVDFTYPDVLVINYSLIPTVNSSEYWDNMDTINTTQMENSGGVLNILESWLNSFGNGLWCALTGCTMSGDINMGDNNITDVDWLYAKNVNVSEDLYVSNSSVYIGNVKISETGENVLTIENATVTSRSFIGEGSGLYNLTINITNGTIQAPGFIGENFTGDNFTGGNFTGDYFTGNYFCNATNCYNITELLEGQTIGAFEENISISVSGGIGTNISSNYDYLITQIIVTPATASTTYRFEATESPGGSMIDRDRILHIGEWNIAKSYSINGAVALNITSSSADEVFNVKIKYVDTYLP